MSCCMLSFRWFPGVWNLCADVSEYPASSIFIGGVSKKKVELTECSETSSQNSDAGESPKRKKCDIQNTAKVCSQEHNNLFRNYKRRIFVTATTTVHKRTFSWVRSVDLISRPVPLAFVSALASYDSSSTSPVAGWPAFSPNWGTKCNRIIRPKTVPA